MTLKLTNTEEMDIQYDKLEPRHLRVIYELTRSLITVQDAANVLEHVLEQLIEETGAEVGAFIYYDETENRFTPQIIRSKHRDESIQFSQTIFRKVLESKEAVLSFDVQNDAEYRGSSSVVMHDIHAVLAFPLIVENRVYGIMYFDSRKNRQRFNEAARQLLSFFAPIASLTLEHVLRKNAIEKENLLLKNKIEQTAGIPNLIGETPVMKRLFHLIKKVAASDVSVLITGENGTGKDLVARAIHELSPRRNKPFIAQYIGNIPSTILESELFGYKKGAFTGAHTDKIGLFEAVNGGTLFLDEIAELPTELQTKLLRVLQNKEIIRLGENFVRKIDVRIIAATNQNLVELVKSGKFREDLYYRINVINIEVPPLRERKEDIPLLVKHFLERENLEKPIRITSAAMKKLMSYNWPGNVRQLENIIKRALIFCDGEVIDANDIQFDELDVPQFEGTLEEFKNMLIIQRLKEFNGNKTKAAKSLGISLRTLQQKVKELGL
ncbi:MAG: sigma-54-dependent Fis family transcriptional regulator [Calditrichaeota bacterium]|nr:sigma-54-dependent Fis family transcriptional regulator [Calditrichota bacterium]